MMLTLLAAWSTAAPLQTADLRADAFGLKADGTTDDGPAIARMLEAASRTVQPVRLVFPSRKRIRVLSAPSRYVFRFDGASNVTVDGQGSTFVLGPDVRFMRMRSSRSMTVRRLNVDFDPLPFVDGSVTSVDVSNASIEVEVGRSNVDRLLGGPTGEDGEQAFFGMIWRRGAYGLVSSHYLIERVDRSPVSGHVVIRSRPGFGEFDSFSQGAWRISVPVPGIAHRHGPGACIELHDNETLTFEDVELWSAPWFGFSVLRNSGHTVFRNTHIRPKPRSGRLTSTWRDGFHVKGNSGSLLWEGCRLDGMNDDALNISNHCSRVRSVISPTQIEVLQAFPLGVMPWHEGAVLEAAETATASLLGRARIVRVIGWSTDRRIDDQPAASPVTLELDQPIAGIRPDALVWQPEHANHDTTLRRCTIRNSCRLQSSVRLEECDVTALLWFYCEPIEGPYPSRVVVRDCTLRRGRGNPRLAVAFSGVAERSGRASAIRDVVFERNQVRGDVAMIGVDGLRMADNRFLEAGASTRIEGCTDEHGRPITTPNGRTR